MIPWTTMQGDHRLLLLDIISFFFSSRRRHTRFDCDWSSDVCSSDLVERLPGARLGGALRLAPAAVHTGPTSRPADRDHVPAADRVSPPAGRRIGAQRRAGHGEAAARPRAPPGRDPAPPPRAPAGTAA